jgi:hypothetical protein
MQGMKIRPSFHRLLLVPYLVLACATAVCVFLYLVGRDRQIDWMTAWAPNVAASTVSILLTVFLIDSVLQRNADRERDRVRRLALGTLRFALVRHLTLMAGVFKAAADVVPPDHPIDPEHIFNEYYFSQVRFLDFSKPAPTVPARKWLDYIDAEVREFREALGKVVDVYAGFLDARSLEAIQRLVDSDLLGLLLQLRGIPAVDQDLGLTRSYTFLAGDGVDELTRTHAADFVALVHIYREAFPEGNGPMAEDLHRSDVSPAVGSARYSGPMSDPKLGAGARPPWAARANG